MPFKYSISDNEETFFGNLLTLSKSRLSSISWLSASVPENHIIWFTKKKGQQKKVSNEVKLFSTLGIL